MEESCLLKLHETECEILDAIVKVCENNQLRYYLVGGTLLGAVRHKGFIPWDDDLDIAMPRKDYNKFLKLARNEIDSRYFLQTCYTDKGHASIFSKVRKNNTLFLEDNCKCVKKHHGIFVDIFPLDDGQEKIISKLPFLKRVAYSINSYVLFKRSCFKYPKLFKKLVFSIFPSSLLIRIRDFLFLGSGDCYVNYGSNYGVKKQTIKKSCYDPAVKLEFEGRLYNVPKDYDYVLRRIYGDNYMQLPPVEKRVTHNPVRLSFDTYGEDERM